MFTSAEGEKPTRQNDGVEASYIRGAPSLGWNHSLSKSDLIPLSQDAEQLNTRRTRSTTQRGSLTLVIIAYALLTGTALFWMVSFCPARVVPYHNKDRSEVDGASQDPEWMTKKFFPDPEYDFVGPAFGPNGPDNQESWMNGTATPTDFDTMVRYLKAFTTANKYASYHEVLGNSTEGFRFPYIHLKRGDFKRKVRVWVQGEAHGNEPGGAASIYEFVGKFDWKLLENMEFIILPRYNPDGTRHFSRRLVSGIDPNRDHVLVTQPETRYIKTQLNKFSPHVIVDMHEYTPYRNLNGRYTAAADGLFSDAKNLNIDASIRELTASLFAERIRGDMRKHGYTFHDYMTIGQTLPNSSLPLRYNGATSAASIGRNSHGLTQAISFLTETRGINLADQHFRRRTATGLTMLTAIVNTAHENADLILETVEGARKRVIHAGRLGTGNIVVTDTRPLGTKNVTFIDTVAQEAVAVEVDFAYSNPTIPNIIRPRPHAYIIPPSLSNISDDMEVLGLRTEILETSFSVQVEVLKIVELSESGRYTSVTTEPEEREVTLEVGSAIIRTDQQNAGLAFAALEPETVDSYWTAGKLQLELGGDYPIYRVMTDTFGPTNAADVIGGDFS